MPNKAFFIYSCQTLWVLVKHKPIFKVVPTFSVNIVIIKRYLSRKLNSAVYKFRRNSWKIRPARCFNTKARLTGINRPIFLLGTQGGGLTLISRVLRRHPEIISATGDNSYWCGADEIQNVYGSILPPELTGLLHKQPQIAGYGKSLGWVYANDECLPFFRKTKEDATSESREKYLQVLNLILRLHGRKSKTEKRLIDKSQTNTVRLGFIDKLLEGCSPFFVLVVRNPYALVFRAATRIRIIREKKLSWDNKIELAAQHWRNSMSCCLEDAESISGHFAWMRFEDFLKYPKDTLYKLGQTLGLNVNEQMLPQQDDRFPWGHASTKKWYPLREDVNQRYLESISKKDSDIIYSICKEEIRFFSY